MRNEIDAMKSGLEGMPDGLDGEILRAIEQAEQMGKAQAVSDISNVEQQLDNAKEKGNTINAQIDQKLNQNTSAIGKLESIKNNRFGKGADSAICAVRENTKTGEELQKDLERAMQQATSDIHSAKNGI
jgi:chlorite dismutase